MVLLLTGSWTRRARGRLEAGEAEAECQGKPGGEVGSESPGSRCRFSARFRQQSQPAGERNNQVYPRAPSPPNSHASSPSLELEITG